MNYCFLKKCLVLLSALGSLTANAVTVTKVTIDTDVTQSYNMYESGKMYFSGGSLVLDTLGNGSIVKKNLATINQMRFALVDVSATGVETVLSSSPALTVFPSLVKESVTIRTDKDEQVDYEICNVSGQNVLRGTVVSGGTVDLSSLPKGIYFVRVNGSLVKITKL